MIKKVISMIIAAVTAVSGVNVEAISVIESTNNSEIVSTGNYDNTNIHTETNVNVIKVCNGTETVVYTGLLSEYENGMFLNADFSKSQAFIILNWDNPNEIYYILPQESENVNISEGNDNLNQNNVETNILSATQSLASDILIDVNLMYDDIYYEKIMIKNKRLSVPIKISNTSGEKKDIVCYIGEYDDSGRLIASVSSTSIPIENGQTITVNTEKTFNINADTAKIFIWDNENMRPVTSAIKLDETLQDYYSDNFSDAGFYDLSHNLRGSINNISDVDYIKFIPEKSGKYTFKCISANNTLMTFYPSYQSAQVEDKIYFMRNMTAGNTYCLKLYNPNSTDEYLVSVQYDVGEDTENFNIYDFDINTNVYKKSILIMCEDLYYDNSELSKEMYKKYEDILVEETKIHALPDFLTPYPKEMDNFDEIINLYYSTKYEELKNVQTKYIELIDEYTLADYDLQQLQQTNSNVINTEDYTITGEYPIIGQNYPPLNHSDETKEIENNTIEKNISVNSENTEASFTITRVTSTSIEYKAVYPSSEDKGNAIWIVDFNTDNGITVEKNAHGHDAIYRRDGSDIITGLKPGGIYIISMLWSTNGGTTYGYENSISRFVQLPCDTTETLQTYDNGGRISAYMEPKDRKLASDSDFNKWLNRMDKAYNAFRELTGYTPYNSQKIVMQSTRDNLNEYLGIEDGKNYWEVIFGYYDDTRIFKHSKAFNQGLMRRLSFDDWGDTPMHELSHAFDYYGWVFDSETLAQLKLYYVVSTLNAKIYRPDRFDSIGEGWYTGENYYTLLKRDRYLDSYTNSFDKGHYASEGFAAILIDIQRKTGWEPFKKTFRYFNSLISSQMPYEDGEILKLFLTKLKDYSGEDVLGYISNRDTGIIEDHYGIVLEYVEPKYPSISGGGSLEKISSEVNADEGNYAVCEFKPTDSANYYIYTSSFAGSGLSNDTYIEVYTSESLSGTPIASNDDYDGGRFSKVSIAVTQGNTYYIKVRHYSGGQLHAELNITKNMPKQELTSGGCQDIITAKGEFALYEFTPIQTSTYVFEVSNYNNGASEYDTYIKLYENESMTKRLGNDENKILANLKAGHTYYLQFSGYLMKYARGRINVRQGQTIEFKKRTDSSFIYVNSPEFITRFDIVDDEKSSMGRLKLFEQENIQGKNTYYQTHTVWYGEYPEIYEPYGNFYVDVDFYNPTDEEITISVSNLAYGTEYSILKYYFNGNGTNVNITIPAYEHRLLFETLNAPFIMDYPGPPIDGDGWNWDRHRSPIILFDFEVNGGEAVVSSLAAYDRENLYLKNGYKNIIKNTGEALDSGEVISNLEDRRNEIDLYGKYKGIAKNQSAWIDVDLEFVLDDLTPKGQPLTVYLKDEQYPDGIQNPKTWWMTNINPLNDEYVGLLYAMPGNQHRFTYHRDEGGIWNFAYDYRDIRFINNNAVGNESVNDKVADDILEKAAMDVKNGVKEHFAGAPDKFSCVMGGWGAIYHYTVTVTNNTNSEKTVSYQAKTFENMIFGYNPSNAEYYSDPQFIPKIGNNDSEWRSLQNVTIPANKTISFEIVTMLGGGTGGTNNRILLN